MELSSELVEAQKVPIDDFELEERLIKLISQGHNSPTELIRMLSISADKLYQIINRLIVSRRIKKIRKERRVYYVLVRRVRIILFAYNSESNVDIYELFYLPWEIDRTSTGFVYLISLYGITGARDRIPETAFNLLRRARKICRNKLAVGFGVSRREHIERLLRGERMALLWEVL